MLHEALSSVPDDRSRATLRGVQAHLMTRKLRDTLSPREVELIDRQAQHDGEDDEVRPRDNDTLPPVDLNPTLPQPFRRPVDDPAVDAEWRRQLKTPQESAESRQAARDPRIPETLDFLARACADDRPLAWSSLPDRIDALAPPADTAPLRFAETETTEPQPREPFALRTPADHDTPVDPAAEELPRPPDAYERAQDALWDSLTEEQRTDRILAGLGRAAQQRRVGPPIVTTVTNGQPAAIYSTEHAIPPPLHAPHPQGRVHFAHTERLPVLSAPVLALAATDTAPESTHTPAVVLDPARNAPTVRVPGRSSAPPPSDPSPGVPTRAQLLRRYIGVTGGALGALLFVAVLVHLSSPKPSTTRPTVSTNPEAPATGTSPASPATSITAPAPARETLQTASTQPQDRPAPAIASASPPRQSREHPRAVGMPTGEFKPWAPASATTPATPRPAPTTTGAANDDTP